MNHHLVILDLGNVLLDLHFDRFISRCAEVSTKSADEIRAKYIEGEMKPKIERGEITDQAFFAWMADWLRWPPERKDDLIFFWCDIFSETPGGRQALAHFRSQSPVWILTDADLAHIDFIRKRFPWSLEADRVITSYERGKCKADPGAFEEIVEWADLPAREILFYDDLEVNVNAAKSAGIDARLFTTWDKVLGSGNAAP